MNGSPLEMLPVVGLPCCGGLVMIATAIGFVAIVVLIIRAAIVGSKRERERQSAVARWAKAKRLVLAPGKDRHFKDRFPQFKCFRQGERDRYAFEVMRGQWNHRKLIAFCYHYETTSRDKDGKTTTTSWYFSGVLLEPLFVLKSLSIGSENFFHRIADALGFDDIDFESAEFSRKFRVKSPDRKWAYDVLHARTMEFLLSQPRFTIEFAEDWTLAYRSGRLNPQEYEQAIGVLEGILDRLPDYVKQQQGLTL